MNKAHEPVRNPDTKKPISLTKVVSALGASYVIGSSVGAVAGQSTFDARLHEVETLLHTDPKARELTPPEVTPQISFGFDAREAIKRTLRDKQLHNAMGEKPQESPPTYADVENDRQYFTDHHQQEGGAAGIGLASLALLGGLAASAGKKNEKQLQEKPAHRHVYNLERRNAAEPDDKGHRRG